MLKNSIKSEKNQAKQKSLIIGFGSIFLFLRGGGVYGYQSQNPAFLACLVQLHCCQNMATLFILQRALQVQDLDRCESLTVMTPFGNCWVSGGRSLDSINPKYQPLRKILNLKIFTEFVKCIRKHLFGFRRKFFEKFYFSTSFSL